MERGLYVHGMISGKPSKEISKFSEQRTSYRYDLDATIVLWNCSDFLAEKGALASLIESRGHICISSPKCRPELAGNGIEYGWGIW